MKLGYTLHEIIAAKRHKLPIKSVQAFDDEEFTRLLALDAVREPTEAEVAIYESIHGKPEKPVKSTRASKADDQKADDQKADDQKADDQKAANQKADDQKADDQKDPDEVEKL